MTSWAEPGAATDAPVPVAVRRCSPAVGEAAVRAFHWRRTRYRLHRRYPYALPTRSSGTGGAGG